MEQISVCGKTFNKYISSEKIDSAVEQLAQQINIDYKHKERVVFLGVLNGAFMFLSDLMKKIEFNAEVSFIKVASYAGQESSGEVKELIGLSSSIEGCHVVIVEDVVDTGNSISFLMSTLAKYRPESIEIATLLYKPEAYMKNIPIKYRAFSIANEFVIGYGLDLDQYGRNYKNIYIISE